MEKKNGEAAALDHVRSIQQTAEILGVSTRTLHRMQLRGEAPPRIKISDRIFGYRDSAIDHFLASRVEA